MYAATNWLRAMGHSVKTKLYFGYRHETYNYNDIRNVAVEWGLAGRDCLFSIGHKLLKYKKQHVAENARKY